MPDTITHPTDAFESIMLPHLDAAWNLARHLSGNDHDAEDLVQESYLRALRFFDTFRGENARGWLLAIVRHTAHSARRRERLSVITTEFNEEVHTDTATSLGPSHDLDQRESAHAVHAALDQLPPQFREVLVLRELEDLPYEEIARIVRAPVGTVMSRLSRGRARLARLLSPSIRAVP